MSFACNVSISSPSDGDLFLNSFIRVSAFVEPNISNADTAECKLYSNGIVEEQLSGQNGSFEMFATKNLSNGRNQLAVSCTDDAWVSYCSAGASVVLRETLGDKADLLTPLVLGYMLMIGGALVLLYFAGKAAFVGEGDGIFEVAIGLIGWFAFFGIFLEAQRQIGISAAIFPALNVAFALAASLIVMTGGVAALAWFKWLRRKKEERA